MCGNRHGQLSAERLTDRTVALVVKRSATIIETLKPAIR